MIDLKSPILLEQSNGVFLDINTILDEGSFSPTTPLSGYRVKSITTGAATPIGYEDPRATRDGIDVGDAYIGRRIIQLTVDVYGNSRQDLAGKINNAVKAMRFVPKRFTLVDGFRKLKFTILTNDVANYPSGSIDGFSIVRPAAMPQTSSDPTVFSGSDGAGYSSQLVLSFVMKSPYKYSSTLKEYIAPADDSTLVSLHNHGSSPAYGEVLIYKTTSGLNASEVQFKITLNGTPLDLSIPAGKIGDDETYEYKILINYDEQTVYDQVVTKSNGLITTTLNQSYIIVNSGALFGLIDPDDDIVSGEPSKIKVRAQQSNGTIISTGYSYRITWREAWY
jgi:hypothetical protein